LKQQAYTALDLPPSDHDLPVYDTAHAGPAWWTEAVELWQYRDLIAQLAARDIKVRYKRSVIGVAWTLLNPLLMMVVYTLAFRHIFLADSPGYPVFLLTGITAWGFFAQTTVVGMYQLLGGGSLLTRIYVPRTVFAVSATIVGLVNLLLSLGPLVAVMLATGVPVTVALAWLPLSMVVLAIFTLGVTLIVSSLLIRFHDVVDIYQVLLQAWFFWTPVIYPPDFIPGDQTWRLMTNPMAHMIALFRDPISEGRSPENVTLIVASLVALITLVVGWRLFTARTDELAYRL
jgi:ABC-type polysaccharide/polyol phosphate export permease